ncbi:ARM repeat superfamily protein [Zea mays]|uniref:ARM repeat superfamily protein n=1 Tax=Zea mays TaxID=4577 RepID=A0A1D6GLR9_MAIZE|nr:ARM repeat superfamily protein [Zea mays]
MMTNCITIQNPPTSASPVDACPDRRWLPPLWLLWQGTLQRRETHL